MFVHLAGRWANGGKTTRGRGFRRTDRRRTNILRRVSATGSGCLRCFRLRFCRIALRARHAMPPDQLVVEKNWRPTNAPPDPP